MQEQTIPQQLRDSRIGVDDLDLIAHAALAQILIEHQGGFHRRDTALMGHVGRLRKCHADEDAAFFDRAQLVVELHGWIVKIEMIAALLQPRNTLGGRNASG